MRFGNVDYRELGNRKGPAEFLAGLIDRELREPEPASAVIFCRSVGAVRRGSSEVRHQGYALRAEILLSSNSI